MLRQLESGERMRLMKFVCSFAWADLEIHPGERQFVARLIERLDLEPGERRQVRRWLEVPPEPGDVDPTQIPREHRTLFVNSVQGIIAADGRIAPEEREALALFRALLA